MSFRQLIAEWNEEQDKWLDEFKVVSKNKYNKFLANAAKNPVHVKKQKEINKISGTGSARRKAQMQRRLVEAIEQDARQAISNKYIRTYRTILDDLFKAGKVQTRKAGPLYLNERVRNPGARDGKLVPPKVLPGMWYIFRYDPKTKDTLDYYDNLPLVFVLSADKKGFTGLNFHHMDPTLRRYVYQLMEQFKRGHKYRAFIDLDWAVIKRAKKFRLLRPIIKRYNYANVRSKFSRIPDDDWELSLIIPSLRLKKLPNDAVWKRTKKEAYRL